jgi:hypothetical protein
MRQSQLFADVLAMKFNGPLGDKQPACYFLIGQTFNNHIRNLIFPPG